MIIMRFKKGGAVHVEARGYPGDLCHEATREYLRAFGGEQRTVEVDDGAARLPLTEHEQLKENR